MEISIRRATFEDYDSLCDLFDEVDALHREHLPHLFQEPDGPVREKAYYLALTTDENVGLFVAEAGKTMVGFIQAVIEDTPDHPLLVPRRFSVVENIVVKADFQHHGIGRILMNAAEAWALARGATSIELNVYEFNEAAQAFYRQLGYITQRRRMVKEFRDDENG